MCLVLYLVLAIVEFGPLNSLGAGRMTGVQTPDQIQQVWFLEWAQYALSHGHNPFFSQWQNYPVGLNLGVNTSMLALGLVFSPITSLFGAVVTWNVLLRLALFASASSMCLVLRRWTTWWPAAFVGGLLYGFSAYTTFNGVGYLFLVFVPLPPLIFLLLHEILVRQRWRPARTGLLLGVTCAVQYLISVEILASTVLMGTIACVLFLCVHRKEFATKRPYMRTAVSYSLIVGGVLLVYPLIFTLFGPAHINGVPKLVGDQDDLFGPFVPGHEQWLAPQYFSSIWTNFELYFYSAPLYQGIPFFIGLVSIVVWLRRRPIVLLAGAMTAIALILSFGSTLYADGHNTSIPLPYAILAHLPILEGIVAPRFTLFTALFGAGVVAIGLDELYRRLRQSIRLERLLRSWRGVGAAGVSLAVAAVVAIPLVPSHTQPTSSTHVPSVFTSSSGSPIPDGSVVLAYPYPNSPVKVLRGRPVVYFPFVETIDDALLGQSVSRMRFKLIGGYGWMPPKPVDGTPDPSPLKPLSVEALFNVLFYGSGTHAQQELLSRSNLTADLRLFMGDYHVGTVIVLPLGRHPATVVGHVTAAIGPPSEDHGATVWFHVQQRLSSLAS